MAVPLGGKHYFGNWEFYSPEMSRRDIKMEDALKHCPDIEAVISDFKKYVDEHPYFTFERNFGSYHNDVHPYQCRIISEPQYLRIVRPYAKKVHKQFVDEQKR
jgi:hypothetical protein